MTTALFGLASNLSVATLPPDLSSRAKQASLLFDAVVLKTGAVPLVDGGGGETARHRERMRVPREAVARQVATQRHAVLSASEFEALTDSLRLLGCEWAGLIVPPEAGRRADAGWEEAVVDDLRTAGRLGAVLVPAAAAGSALLTQSAEVSARAVVAPDPSSLTWEQVARAREDSEVIAARRLVREITQLLDGSSVAPALRTFETFAEDIEELLWGSYQRRAPTATEALVCRLAVAGEGHLASPFLLIERKAL